MKIKHSKNNYSVFSVLIFCLLATPASTQNLSASCSDYIEYQIREGDTLSSIARDFGHKEFKEFISKANSERLGNTTDLIPGQVLRIPTKIYHFKDSNQSFREVLADPFCDSSSSNNKVKVRPQEFSGLQEADTSETEKLEKFREAFESLT